MVNYSKFEDMTTQTSETYPRLDPEQLSRVTDPTAYGANFNNGTQLFNWRETRPPQPRDDFESYEAYQEHVAQTNALNLLLRSRFDPPHNFERIESRFRQLMADGDEIAVDHEAIIGLEGIRDMFRARARQLLEQRASQLTKALGEVGFGLWVVVKNSSDPCPLAARIDRVVVTEADGSEGDIAMNLEPLVWSRGRKQRGLLPTDYPMTPYPFYSTKN